jgi:hypothetical protein
METSHHRITDLPGGRVLRIDDGAGRGIAVFDGMVWITQTGDERDVFLRRGETFHFDRGGIAIVEALRDAQLVMWDAPSDGGGRGAPGRIAATAVAGAVALGAGAFLMTGGEPAPQQMAWADAAR